MAVEQSWGRERGNAARRWRLDVAADEVVVATAGRDLVLMGEDVRKVRVTRGWFTARVDIAGSPPLQLRGLRRGDAPDVSTAVRRVLLRHRALPAVTRTVTWYRRVRTEADQAGKSGRWISRETRRSWVAARPGRGTREALTAAAALLEDLCDEKDLSAVRFLQDVDLDSWVDARNEEILAAETARHAEFFARIESRPLTEEQIRAVVSFDNRVLVVAAAGSGKTSVMVARAAYAVLRGFVPPERILLLAFNDAAAKQLQVRVDRGLRRVGLSAVGVRAQTFHAFGLGVLGQASGRKPRVAAWVEEQDGVPAVSRLVDELRDGSPGYTFRWDVFRLLHARARGGADAPAGSADDQEHRTAAGGFVRSEGERLIADFLFFNGVAYTYEKPYVHDVADAGHGQYRPDFHYVTPTGELWHEHWALDAHGRAPTHFVGYEESMRWKKAVHAQYGTKLLETTSSQITGPQGLQEFARSLQAHGVVLDWNPDRVARTEAMAHEELAGLIRRFLTHVKANSLTRADLDRRLTERDPVGGRTRTRLFLDLFWPIHDEWNARLRAENAVDFEDMLIGAAEQLENAVVPVDHDLVLVDEFQDASQARARLTRSLVAAHGRYLLAVGDDWQSINRFAGADIAVMTDFSREFGEGPSLRLQTTFRCPQQLCDTAGAFVGKNPHQLTKNVRSVHEDPGPQVRLVVAAGREQLREELQRELDRLTARHAGRPGEDAPSVLVLGRYRAEKERVVRGTRGDRLDVRFSTAHASKGIEADYVIVPGLLRGGFPSRVEDDPVLGLAMAQPDDHPHAEERRLLYVALTRARREVTLLTVAGQESSFVMELLQDDQLDVVRSPGPPPQPCPGCGQGSLVARTSRHGAFFGCSRFPDCRHTVSARDRPVHGKNLHNGT